jgi:hypothetical protein
VYIARTLCPIGLTGYASPTRAYTPWMAGTGLRMGGGCKCGGSCAGCSVMGRHHHGMGIFDTTDFSQWGWQEWGIILVGGYFVLSLIGDIGAGSRKISSYRSKGRTRRKKRAEIKARMAKLKEEYQGI